MIMYKRRVIVETSERPITKGFCSEERTAELLGDKIIKAMKYGADLGITCVPEYDENLSLIHI